MIDYRDVGLKTYGKKCEWIGCGWEHAVEVHHTNYQEHQVEENRLRKEKSDPHFQLPKSVLSKDLSVLCPNHHTYTHLHDQGLDVLKYLPERVSK